jgi:hypothetical protein
VLEYACPDRCRGYAVLFNLQGGAEEHRLRLRGGGGGDRGADNKVP